MLGWGFFKDIGIIFFSINLYSQPLDESLKSIKAIKINTEEITLDGKLDEPFWNNIIGIDDFLMQDQRFVLDFE